MPGSSSWPPSHAPTCTPSLTSAAPRQPAGSQARTDNSRCATYGGTSLAANRAGIAPRRMNTGPPARYGDAAGGCQYGTSSNSSPAAASRRLTRQGKPRALSAMRRTA